MPQPPSAACRRRAALAAAVRPAQRRRTSVVLGSITMFCPLVVEEDHTTSSLVVRRNFNHRGVRRGTIDLKAYEEGLPVEAYHKSERLCCLCCDDVRTLRGPASWQWSPRHGLKFVSSSVTYMKSRVCRVRKRPGLSTIEPMNFARPIEPSSCGKNSDVSTYGVLMSSCIA